MNDDAKVEQRELPGYVNIGAPLKDSGVSGRVHELRDYLSRPLVCHQGTWTTLDTAGSNLLVMSMPEHIFALESIRDKLRGFLGFRAKMVIEVQLNAQRFQQGRLIVAYMPTPEAEATPDIRLNTALSKLTYITQLPHVDLDATETSCALEVPYVGPQLFYDLTDGRGRYGNFYIFVYSPLTAVTAPLNCDFTVWCHFEDVEVVYPTIVGPEGPLVSQSGKIRRRRGAGVGTTSISDSELDSHNLGPISSFLNKVSDAAGILSEVPLISSFSAPTSWISGVLARSAQVFGLSKPTVSAPPKPVQLRSFAQMNNYNSADHSMRMGLAADNSLQHMPGFAGSDLDEMTISYLCGIPAFVSSYLWTTSDVEGDQLIKKAVSPCYYIAATPDASLFATETVGTKLVFHTPPFSYIAQAFRRWRGGITFTFKIIKTEFHSGRLMCVFTPLGDNVPFTADSYSNSQYCFRQVFDLRSANEFTITVPFVYLQPWQDVRFYTGFLAVYVLNELRAPDSVSNSVEILVEVSGAPDMEFQFPVNVKTFTPALSLDAPAVIPEGMSLVAPVVEESEVLPTFSGLEPGLEKDVVYDDLPNTNEVLVPQSGGRPANVSNVINPIDQDAVNRQVIEPVAYCAGEAVRSLRQLMKRFCGSYTNPAGVPILVKLPFGFYLPTYNSGGIQSIPAHRIDMLNYFGPLYAFNRGSVRYKVMFLAVPAASSLSALLTASDAVSATEVYGTGSAAAATNVLDNRAIAFTQFSGGIEAEVPAYQKGHCRFRNVVTLGQAGKLGGSWHADQQLTFFNNEGSSIGINSTVYRAIGDDYSAGFFIGTMPLVQL